MSGVRSCVATFSTHATLLARLSAGADHGAWSEFHARYAVLIRAFALRRGVQPADSDDVVQDVLLALSRSMPGFTYDPERGRFRGYLKTLTVRAISRKCRQNRPAAPLWDNGEALVDPAPAETELAWEDEWRRHHVRRAMRELEAEFNDLDRLAFTEYAMAGRPARDVATALGLSVDQVYQAKSRLLRRLTEIIAEHVSDEG